jgi:hypothetical protein
MPWKVGTQIKMINKIEKEVQLIQMVQLKGMEAIKIRPQIILRIVAQEVLMLTDR